MMPACGIKVPPCFTLEKIGDAPVDMGRPSGDAEDQVSGLVRLGPHRPARRGPMCDAMWNTAQWNHDPMRKRSGFGKPGKTCRDPPTVFLCEFTCGLETAARRHGQDHVPRGSINPQCVAASRWVTAQAHPVGRGVERYFNR